MIIEDDTSVHKHETEANLAHRQRQRRLRRQRGRDDDDNAIFHHTNMRKIIQLRSQLLKTTRVEFASNAKNPRELFVFNNT